MIRPLLTLNQDSPEGARKKSRDRGVLLEPGSPGFESSFVSEQLCDLPKLRFLHLKNGGNNTYRVDFRLSRKPSSLMPGPASLGEDRLLLWARLAASALPYKAWQLPALPAVLPAPDSRAVLLGCGPSTRTAWHGEGDTEPSGERSVAAFVIITTLTRAMTVPGSGPRALQVWKPAPAPHPTPSSSQGSPLPAAL